jgi:hypothetical protein
MTGFDTDFADARELSPLAAKARQVLETVEDIEMTAGSEDYRAVYETLKAATPPRKGGDRRGKPQDETASR